MNWIALKTDKLLTNGEICVPVTYTSDSGETSYESYRTRVMSPDWPDSLIRARLIELNAIDLSLVELGSVKPPPIIPSPTQDELDLTEFVALMDDYRRKQIEVKAAVGRSTQADVDDALVAWKAKYREQYARYLSGLV